MNSRPLRRSSVSIEQEVGERQSRFLQVVLILFGTLCLVAFLYAAFDRSGSFQGNKAFLLLPIFLSVLLAFASPLACALAVFLAIPFFGNFPGGRFMEILNIPLAASTVGLVVRALRRGSPPPRGRLWLAALLYLFSAAIALLPSLEGVAVRLAQIASLPEAVVQTLTAREIDPLYSLSSLILLLLAAAWAYAFAWAAPWLEFARNALRSVWASFLLVVALGIAGLHGAVDLEGLLKRIDARSVSYLGFQSIFWNPSWFAFYFAMAFGLLLGLFWVESRRKRWLLAGTLAVSYFYFLSNPQRGGFLAVHAALLAVGIYFMVSRRWNRRTLLASAAVLLFFAALAATAFKIGPGTGPRGLSVTRLSEKDPVREKLAVVSMLMWRDFPLFGLGEGAFTWRHREYVPAGSELDTGFWGDAHNTWLHFLATRGLFGLVAYILLLFFLARRVLRAARQRGPGRGIALGLGFSLVAFVTYSFVQYMFYLQAIQALFWGIVALAAIAAPVEPDSASLGRRARWMIAIAALAAVGLQVWWSWPRFEKAQARIAAEPRGFYEIERWGADGPSMRWSSRSGILCLYPQAPVVTLPMLIADPGVASRPITVSIETEGWLLDRFEINSNAPYARSFYLFETRETGGLETGRTRVGETPIPFGECVAEAWPVPLSVAVSRTWSPLSLGFGGDTRHLGVAVFEPSFAPTQSATDLGLSPSETEGHRQFRWTGARASIGIRLPAGRATITLPLRAGNPDLKRRPVRVEAFWNNRPAASTSLSTFNWRELQFEVIAPDRWGVLTLQVDRVWQPKAYGAGDSLRYLGVQMGVPRVEAAMPAGSSRAPTDHS